MGMNSHPNVAVFSINANAPYEWNGPLGNFTLPWTETSFSTSLLSYIDPTTQRLTTVVGSNSGLLYFLDLEQTYNGSSSLRIDIGSPILSIALRTGYNQAIVFSALPQIFTGWIYIISLSSRQILSQQLVTLSGGSLSPPSVDSKYDQKTDTYFFIMQTESSSQVFTQLISFSPSTSTVSVVIPQLLTSASNINAASMLIQHDFRSLFLCNNQQLIRFPLSDFGPVYPPLSSSASATPLPAFQLWTTDPARNLLYLVSYNTSSSTVTISCANATTGLSTSNTSSLCPIPYTFAVPPPSASTQTPLCAVAYSQQYQSLFIALCSSQLIGVSTASLPSFVPLGNVSLDLSIYIPPTISITMDVDEPSGFLLVLVSSGPFLLVSIPSFPPPYSNDIFAINIDTTMNFSPANSFVDLELLGNSYVSVLCTAFPCTFLTLNYANPANIQIINAPYCVIFGPNNLNVPFIANFFAYEPYSNQLVLSGAGNVLMTINPLIPSPSSSSLFECSGASQITLPFNPSDPTVSSMAIHSPTRSVFLTLASNDGSVNLMRVNLTTTAVEGVTSLPNYFRFQRFCNSSSLRLSNTLMVSNGSFISTTLGMIISDPYPPQILPIQVSNMTIAQQSQNAVILSTVIQSNSAAGSSFFDLPGNNAMLWLPSLSGTQGPRLLLTTSSSALSQQSLPASSEFFIDPYTLTITKQFPTFYSKVPTSASSSPSSPSPPPPLLSSFFLSTNWTSIAYPALPYDVIILGQRSDSAGSFATKYLTSCPAGTSNNNEGDSSSDCLACGNGYYSLGGVGSQCIQCNQIFDSPFPLLTYCPVACASALPQPTSFIHIPTLPSLEYISNDDTPKTRLQIIIICCAAVIVLLIAAAVWTSGHWKIAVQAVIDRPSSMSSAPKVETSKSTLLHRLDSFSYSHFTERDSFVYRHTTSLGGYMTLLCLVGSAALLLVNIVSYARYNSLSSSQVQQGATDSILDLTINAQLWGLPAAACIDLRTLNSFAPMDISSASVPAPVSMSFSSQPMFPYTGQPSAYCSITWTCRGCYLPAGLLQTVSVYTYDIRGIASSVTFSITGNRFSGALEGSVLPPNEFVFRGASQPSTVSILFRQNIVRRFNEPDEQSLLPAQLQATKGSSVGSNLYYLNSDGVAGDNTSPGFGLSFAMTLDTAVSLITISQRLSLVESLSLWLAQTTTIFAIGRFLLPQIEQYLIKRLKLPLDSHGSIRNSCLGRFFACICCCFSSSHRRNNNGPIADSALKDSNNVELGNPMRMNVQEPLLPSRSEAEQQSVAIAL